MNDYDMTPRSKPTARTRMRNGEMVEPNNLRAYRASPETINVQIRWNNGFSTASLYYKEALEFANMIRKAAEDLPDSEKVK